MQVKTINYAIVTLTIDQVDTVVSLLEAEGMKKLAEWINENRSSIYAVSPEEWTPYKNESIGDIIERDSNYFLSRTELILDLRDDFLNIHTLNNIRVFFFDALSMYIAKYRELASRIDFACCDGNTKSCCFVINNELPNEIQEKLEEEYLSISPAVSCKYDEGCMNRITYRERELKNFKNQLFIKVFGNPNLDKLDEMYGHSERVPKNLQE